MKHILVIEDDSQLRDALSRKLAKSNFTVSTASDGEEALRVLETLTPDLILLDLIMPKKDGFAVLEAIKKTPALKNIPVIIASNLGQKGDRDKGLQLGAKDFIIKSDTSLTDMVAKINKFLTTQI